MGAGKTETSYDVPLPVNRYTNDPIRMKNMHTCQYFLHLSLHLSVHLYFHGILYISTPN